MTNQHRLTPPQWEAFERYADTSDPYLCLLELRAHIEALEATQQAHKEDLEMTNFSSAARAVLDAYKLAPIKDELTAAAVLRAAVQELKYFGITEKNILAIAAELEGGND